MKHKELIASQGIGLPAGQIVVWILEAFVLAEPIPAQVAIAIGTMLGGIFQYIATRYKREKDYPDNFGGTD